MWNTRSAALQSSFPLADTSSPIWTIRGARDALRGISQPIFWFSYDDPAAQCRAENVVWTDGLPSFDIYIRGSYYAHVSLRVGGKHNVMNALAAASAAYLLGVSGEAVGLGLATFTGAGRRFEYKGSFHGADVYDDYAHHPGELHALLEMGEDASLQAHHLRLQPHTYTRTKALFNDFVKMSCAYPTSSCWQRSTPRASRDTAFRLWT